MRGDSGRNTAKSSVFTVSACRMRMRNRDRVLFVILLIIHKIVPLHRVGTMISHPPGTSFY